MRTKYKAETGNLNEQRRDTLKEYRNQARFILAAMGIENQSSLDNTMPVRVMGYDYSSYRQQITNKTEKLYPVITIVLNFTNQKWNVAKSIQELIHIPEEFAKYVQDYRIRVFDIAFLEDEAINQFQSDFKVIARFFKDKRLGNTDPDDETCIRHAEAVADFLSVFTNDHVYKEILPYIVEKQKKGELITMCTFAQEFISQGRKQGLDQGKMEILYELVSEGDISLSKAAKKGGISEEEFYRNMILKGYKI